ncbi:MAG: hypothetical protein INR70_27660 [Parafilimonas terrae]|jgi:hypothetical protein|nr:hypothetical protein [Parafilimonas terrae]
MRILHRFGRVSQGLIGGGLVGTAALVSRALDATIGLVGRLSERLDERMMALAREANARRRLQGRRQIDPVTLR